MAKAIDGIILKEADTVAEQKLLGIIEQIRLDIMYGHVSLELDIFNGKIKRVEVVEKRKSVQL